MPTHPLMMVFEQPADGNNVPQFIERISEEFLKFIAQRLKELLTESTTWECFEIQGKWENLKKILNFANVYLEKDVIDSRWKKLDYFVLSNGSTTITIFFAMWDLILSNLPSCDHLERWKWKYKKWSFHVFLILQQREAFN